MYICVALTNSFHLRVPWVDGENRTHNLTDERRLFRRNFSHRQENEVWSDICKRGKDTSHLVLVTYAWCSQTSSSRKNLCLKTPSWTQNQTCFEEIISCIPRIENTGTWQMNEGWRFLIHIRLLSSIEYEGEHYNQMTLTYRTIW
jgi:hypothetical protein